MEVKIDIIDTQVDGLTLSVEKAVGSSIILDWKGGDKKDELFVMGSTLDFTMLGMSCEDGQFEDLFTGDETRFKTRMYLPDETTLWTGFVLPDDYSEPYRDSPIPIKVRATDGLGRLKGKFLPDDFYEDEKSIIKILTQCLQLTGLQLNMAFAPAIENSIQKDYDLIYLDTTQFVKSDKKQDAYQILEDVLKSMLCTVFQVDNEWKVEGLNVRNLRVYDITLYNYAGILLSTATITRLQKDVKAIATPQITVQPPYGVIDASHEREDITLGEHVAQEENDGWVISNRVNIEGWDAKSIIYATDWVGHGDYYAEAGLFNDDSVRLASLIGARDVNKFVSLKSRPYLRKGKKYEIQLHLKVDFLFAKTEAERQALIDSGDLTDPFVIDIVSTYTDEFGVVKLTKLFSNDAVSEDSPYHILLQFDVDGEYKRQFNFIPDESGYLDFNIHHAIWDNGISFVTIQELDIMTIALPEVERTLLTSALEYTLKKEIDLTYAGDSTAASKSFRLKKLKAKDEFNTIDIEPIRSFLRDGNWYYSVGLKGANLIKDNIKTVYNNLALVSIVEVIYNYNNSDEHMVVLGDNLDAGGFTVFVYDNNSVSENRDYWDLWSDAFYGIELNSYTQTTANVINRMFEKPIIKLDFSALNNVKINDFINFTYRGKKPFMLSNCKWDIHKGITQLTAIEAFYVSSENLPPVVEAGDDIYLSAGVTSFQINGAAFDPDGFIASYLWTIPGVVLGDDSSPVLQVDNFTQDYAQATLTATDNQGLSAQDKVNIYRVESTGVTLDLISEIEGSNAPVDGTFRERHYQITLDNEISEGAAINFKGSISGEKTNGNYIEIWIMQNGAQIDTLRMSANPYTANNSSSLDFSVNYLAGDAIVFILRSELIVASSFAHSQVYLDTGYFVEGVGNVTGLPITATNNMP